MKNKFIFFLAFIFFIALSFRLLSIVNAQSTMSSSNFHVTWGNFNMTSGKKTSSSFNLTDTVGQNFAQQFTSSGFTMKAGFQYIYAATTETPNTISFSIDNNLIDLTNLVPGVATTATNTISISCSSTQGYEIQAFQKYPLTNSANQAIPNTDCNGFCTIDYSSTWESGYGFGFNAIGYSGLIETGIGTSQYFLNSSFYRPFADSSQSQNPVPIMSQDINVENQQAKINYKVVVDPIQSAGNYQNAISFIAVGKY